MNIIGWWREALWRRLEEEGKAQEHWAVSEGFERLLRSSGKDKQLSKHLDSLSPNKLSYEFLKELREYLYKEMKNFYSLNRVKIRLWEAVKEKISVEKKTAHEGWEFSKWDSFDRLLSEAAKDLQMQWGDKKSSQWETKAHIAKEMRELGYKFKFRI
jgi:hypothetical protein